MSAPAPGPPRGLCPRDLELYGEDVEVEELEHEECRIVARQHDDQLMAYALRTAGH